MGPDGLDGVTPPTGVSESATTAIRYAMDSFATSLIENASRFAKEVIARGSLSSDDVYQPQIQNRRMVIVPPRAALSSLPLAAILPGDGVLEQVVASGKQLHFRPTYSL
jgi:hypothetical protein